MSNQMIPPLLVDKMLATWSFEGGGFVAVVAGGKIPSTVAALDMAQAMIDHKRAELDRLSRQSIEARSGETGTGSIRQDESAVAESETPHN